MLRRRILRSVRPCAVAQAACGSNCVAQAAWLKLCGSRTVLLKGAASTCAAQAARWLRSEGQHSEVFINVFQSLRNKCTHERRPHTERRCFQSRETTSPLTCSQSNPTYNLEADIIFSRRVTGIARRRFEAISYQGKLLRYLHARRTQYLEVAALVALPVTQGLLVALRRRPLRKLRVQHVEFRFGERWLHYVGAGRVGGVVNERVHLREHRGVGRIFSDDALVGLQERGTKAVNHLRDLSLLLDALERAPRRHPLGKTTVSQTIFNDAGSSGKIKFERAVSAKQKSKCPKVSR